MLRRTRITLAPVLFAIGLAICLAVAAPSPAIAKDDQPAQSGITDYSFDNTSPAWPSGDGPRIVIHRHVSPYVQRGSMEPFGTLATTDGFNISWLDAPLSRDMLETTAILMVVNPFHHRGELDFRNFSTLDAPSVYSPEEIAIIRQWVENGGALLVLADHSPFAGGAIKLMEAFGFTPLTGVAIHKDSRPDVIHSNVDYKRDGGGRLIGILADHQITNGEMGRGKIDHFATFEGQAIIPPSTANVLLTLPNGFETLLTWALMRDFDTAPRIDSSGLSQGAVDEVGKGRIAFFGETGAFTAQQTREGVAFGLSAPEADQNADFVLSVLRWLVRYAP